MAIGWWSRRCRPRGLAGWSRATRARRRGAAARPRALGRGLRTSAARTTGCSSSPRTSPASRFEERLAEGPLSVAETLIVGRCLLAGLREVHGLGVLHRAIKPSNIIVDEETPLRRAVLTDFGLARAARLTASSARPARHDGALRLARAGRACSTSKWTSAPTCTRSGPSCSSAWRVDRSSPGDGVRRGPATAPGVAAADAPRPRGRGARVPSTR